MADTEHNETLSGRVALVTGGGRGLGRAIALALARAGARVQVAARSEEELETVVAEMESSGAEARAFVVDLADPEGPRRAVENARDSLGPVQILVNNAGVAPSAPFEKTSLETWNRVLQINATAAFLACRAALPGMREAGWGRIVNIASTAGKVGYPYTAAYTASKHALLGLTRALAAETAGSGITVNAVCPGFAATRLTEESVERIVKATGRSPADARRALEEQSPLGRLLQPEEVARAVLFLAAEGAEAVHGQALTIDGGAVTS